MMTPAIFVIDCGLASASMSPALDVDESGQLPARIPGATAGLPVAAIIASDRPWKLLLSEMIFHRLGDFLSPQAGQLAGRLVGLQPAVAEKRLPRKRVAIQPLGKFDLRLGVKRVARRARACPFASWPRR